MSASSPPSSDKEETLRAARLDQARRLITVGAAGQKLWMTSKCCIVTIVMQMLAAAKASKADTTALNGAVERFDQFVSQQPNSTRADTKCSSKPEAGPSVSIADVSKFLKEAALIWMYRQSVQPADDSIDWVRWLCLLGVFFGCAMQQHLYHGCWWKSFLKQYQDFICAVCGEALYFLLQQWVLQRALVDRPLLVMLVIMLYQFWKGWEKLWQARKAEIEKQAELHLQFQVVLVLCSQLDLSLSDPYLIAEKVKAGPLDQHVNLFVYRHDNKLCARPGLNALIKEPKWQRLTEQFAPPPPSSYNWMSASWSELQNAVYTMLCLCLLKFLFFMLQFADCPIVNFSEAPAPQPQGACKNSFGTWSSLIFVMFIYMSPKRQFGFYVTLTLTIFAGCMALRAFDKNWNGWDSLTGDLLSAWTTIQNALQPSAGYLGENTYAVVIWVTKFVVALILGTWVVKSASRCSKDTLVCCVAMGVVIVLCIISQYRDVPTHI